MGRTGPLGVGTGVGVSAGVVGGEVVGGVGGDDDATGHPKRRC